MQILILSLTVLVASLLQAALGFGFPIITMAVLPMIMDYSKAVAIVQAVATLSTIVLSIKYVKNARWNVLLPFLIPGVIIGALFTAFSMSFTSKTLCIMLGVFFILLSLYNFFLSNKITIKPTKRNGIIAGSVSGIGNGLFSIGGPTTAIYLLSALDSKIEYFACIQIFLATSNFVNIAIRIAMGALIVSDMKYISLGAVLMLAGILLGQKILSSINEKAFKKAVYLLILADGVWMIISNLL